MERNATEINITNATEINTAIDNTIDTAALGTDNLVPLGTISKRRARKMGIDVGHGGGICTLFWDPEEKVVLFYEGDYEKIHKRCGGRRYYVSCSGLSSAGYIWRLAGLWEVGFYRVDTVNPWLAPKEIKGVKVLFPYESHGGVMSLLGSYPIVLLKDDQVVYARLNNWEDLLEKLAAGEDVGGKVLTRHLVYTGGDFIGETGEVSIRFANCYGYVKLYPWQFAENRLYEFCLGEPDERVWQIARLAQLEDGTMVRTSKIGGGLYAAEVLKKDPCEAMTEPPRGWTLLATNVLAKPARDDDDHVFVVGWRRLWPLLEKILVGYANRLPWEEREAFASFARTFTRWPKFSEYEQYFKNDASPAEVVKAIERGIARKVRGDAHYVITEYGRRTAERELIAGLPNDTVVTVEDSWAAGNCQPGTQEFINCNFPGRTQCTVWELKPFAGNWNVMRVLRYVAQRARAAGEEAAE